MQKEIEKGMKNILETKEKDNVKVDIEVVNTKEKTKKKTKNEIKQELLKDAQHKTQETDRLLKMAEIEDIDSSCYMEMDNYVGMVKTASAYGVIIEGAGGTGKTWRVVRHLRDVDYAYTDSFTTPQALYSWMYKNRDKEVLVIDDVAGFFDNPRVLAFLKGGLWHVGDSKNRIIHYMTSKPLQDSEGSFVPSAFVLGARMIIITNKLNRKNLHLQAILTRVNYCFVEVPFEEMLHIMEQVAKKDYDGLSYEERMEVFWFLKKHLSSSTENLSIRTLIKCFQQKVYSNRINKPELWKKLAMVSLLKKNPALVLVEEIIRDTSFVKEEDRIRLFCEKTGRSRATYYRMKEQINRIGE